MKNTLIKSIACSLIIAFAACDSEEKVIDKVFDEVEQGAFLRIVSTEGTVIDVNDTSSTFTMVAAYQDGDGNTLLDHVDFYVSITDTEVSGSDISGTALVETIPASSFAKNEYGEPETSFSFTYGDALTALGIDQADVEGVDSFEVVWELFTTDGRSYTKGDVSGDVSAIGGYYSSPFFYAIAFKCGLTDTSTLFNGDFEVVTDTWEDYAPGETLPVIPDPDDPLSFRILSTNNPYIANPDTSYIKVTVVDDDGNVTLASNECFSYNGWICADVTGDGTINTCTGDMTLNLTFAGVYDGYVLQLTAAN